MGKLPDPWLEVVGIHLTAEHLQMLNLVAWVDDLIISAAQSLLKIQNPHIGSLKFPLLANTMALEPQGGEFIQILNINGNHRITISNIGCEPGHIDVYDSLHINQLPSDTKKVIADLLHHTGKAITIHYFDVQWQSGYNNCGLFAIAFAASLCTGEYATNKTFDQSAMREHLKKCFITGNLYPFPEGKNRRKRAIKVASQETVPIYCLC